MVAPHVYNGGVAKTPESHVTTAPMEFFNAEFAPFVGQDPAKILQ